MDQSTAFMTLKYRYGFGTDTARTLLARADTEALAAVSNDVWLLGYPRDGRRSYDLVGVTR